MLDFSQAPVNPPALHPHEDDTPQIRQYLIDTLETWVPRLLPGVRLVNGQFRAGSVAGEKGSSLVLRLTGEDRGMWLDHATGENGDVFELIKKVLNTDFPGALQTARDIANVPMRRVSHDDLLKKEERRKMFIREAMGQIMRESEPAHEVRPVIAYLNRRHLFPWVNADLRAHGNLLHHPTQRRFPCLVALVRDVEGRIVGLHRTYIDPTTCKKANVEPNKMMLGDCRGGAVRLGQITEDGVLGISEGIETGLAAMQTFGVPVWAALSTTGMRALQLPDTVKRAVIFSDMDSDGQAAAKDLAHRLYNENRRCSIALPKHGDDFAHDLEVEHANSR
jgi:hypothetical protein